MQPKAILGLAKGLGAEIVAEGIEQAAEQRALQVDGCTIGQGFLFGRAVPADEAAMLVEGGGAAIRAG